MSVCVHFRSHPASSCRRSEHPKALQSPFGVPRALSSVSSQPRHSLPALRSLVLQIPFFFFSYLAVCAPGIQPFIFYGLLFAYLGLLPFCPVLPMAAAIPKQPSLLLPPLPSLLPPVPHAASQSPSHPSTQPALHRTPKVALACL